MPEQESFHEAPAWARPIRSLGLRLEGTRLEPILAEFHAELEAAGITRVHPRFYLSTEWGVPFETVAVAIPFYLAHDDLLRYHESRFGHVEGADRADILRYLRHELGHVVNYAYRLHERDDWTQLFGSMGRAYRETYRPKPFSREHVHHLPGWYAQKHPDEDFAETFAVWMTPGSAWRQDYAQWPGALRKLEWCDAVMAQLRDVEPVITDETLDEDVAEIASSMEDLGTLQPGDPGPLHLDVALRSALCDLPSLGGERLPVTELLARLRPALQSEVYRWTGHFPERTARLLSHLSERASALSLTYEARQEQAAIVALSALVTSLAATFVARGRYSA
jgi:hypothetical protein